MQVKDLIVTGDAKIIGNLKANINSQEATQTNSGMMSASDKAKLDGITDSADAVSFAQSITSGTQIGTITINGNATKIFAPTSDGGGVSYSNATQSTDGLMSASDKTKLDGISTGANKYTHPSYTAKSSGFYKVTVDSSGHVSGTTAVTKSDITGLGIPAQDTTYTLSSFGITATAAELNKLDGVTATTAELNYVDGVTSNIQTQLNNKANSSTVSSHTSNTSNPHGVTKAQVGLGNVDNTADANKSVNYANSANYANTAHGLRTYSSNGSSHGTSWILNSQHNRKGNSYFDLYCGDGSIGVQVDRAVNAGWADGASYALVAGDNTPGSYTLKNIAASTGDIVAGSTALADGYIYVVYE